MTQTNDSRQAQGALRQDQSQLIFDEGFSFSGYERDGVYLNLCNKKFLDVSGVSGLDSISDGRGAVFADFDNDGDLDVFLTTIQGQAHLLFRNNVGQENRSLRLMLEGDDSVGRDAYGAVVRVTTSAGTLTKIKSGGAGFISQHDPRLLFGLGRDLRADSIEVTWPDGKIERFATDARAGAALRLRRGTGRAQKMRLAATRLPDPMTRADVLARGLKIRLGQPMPDLPLRTLEGSATSVRALLRPGRRTLLNLWATWCAPCAREMPELENLRVLLAGQGVDLIGLNVDVDPEANITEFLAKTGVQYPIYVAGSSAIEQLFASEELSVPLTIVIDDTGSVSELIPGWSLETRRRLSQLARVEPASLKGRAREKD